MCCCHCNEGAFSELKSLIAKQEGRLAAVEEALLNLENSAIFTSGQTRLAAVEERIPNSYLADIRAALQCPVTTSTLERARQAMKLLERVVAWRDGTSKKGMIDMTVGDVRTFLAAGVKL